MKLNQRTADTCKLPAGKSEHFFWDEDLRGFGLRVRDDARKVWVVGYRSPGGRGYRRVTLGDVAKLTAEQARENAKRIFGDLTRGVDPLTERQAERLGGNKTVRSLVDDYLARKQPTLRPASYRMAAAYLTGGYFRALHSSPIDAVTRADIAVCLNRITKERGPIVARAARAALAAFFNSAWKQGICTQNVVAATEAPAPAQDRSRVLTDDELRAIWNGCTNGYGAIVKLLMLLGARRQEIGNLRWNEIGEDSDGNPVIVLPGSRVKNKTTHTLPLMPMAQEVIDAIPKRGDYLFGSTGFTGWSASKRDLDARIAETYHFVAEWRLHDLRRTVATWLAEHKVLPHIVEAVLNHLDGHKSGVAGIYNKAQYRAPIRQALAVWHDHLESIISGTKRKVIPMRKGA
jgi:integrase